MVLINKKNKNAVTVSTAKVFNDCIQRVLFGKRDVLYMWFPSLSKIEVDKKETIVAFKGEDEEVNLGFTGIEQIIADYVDSFYQ